METIESLDALIDKCRKDIMHFNRAIANTTSQSELAELNAKLTEVSHRWEALRLQRRSS